MNEETTQPSEESPVYGKVQHQAGRLFMITCDEGWRSTILCDSMYEEDADWLLVILGRRPRRVEPEGKPAALREQVAGVAEGLERRAQINRPSKVSEICDGIAGDLRKALA